MSDSRERLVVIAGYGGFPQSHESYDGTHALADVWVSLDAIEWNKTTDNSIFGRRAFFGLAQMHGVDPRVDFIKSATNMSAKVFIFGGGDLGFDLSSTKKLSTVSPRLDAFGSRDMITWTQINYEEGGGLTGNGVCQGTPMYATRKVPWYSSQQWSKVEINSQTVYMGLWGMTVVSFNRTTKAEVIFFKLMNKTII